MVHRYGALARGPSLASSFFLRFSCPDLRAASLALSVLAAALVWRFCWFLPRLVDLLVRARLVGSAPQGSCPCVFIRGVEREVKVGRWCAMLLGRVAVNLSQVATVEPA